MAITQEDVRRTLARLVRQNGESMAELSRWLRLGDRHLSDFVRRGSPQLSQRDAETLEGYFNIDPGLLGGRRSRRGRSAPPFNRPRARW